MFNLTNGKLIKLNDDGTDGEIIQTKLTKLQIGSKLCYDYVILNSDHDIFCEISTDSFGRVSFVIFGE